MKQRTGLPNGLLKRLVISTHRTPCQRRHISDSRPFAPGDLVLLRHKRDRSAAPILTPPLQAGRRIESHRGTIYHDDIIGKRVRDVVKTVTTRSAKEGSDYRLHNVTLDDYVRLSKRLVTPIYPVDANLIVSLLDLHPTSGSIDTVVENGAAKLEILEAGTGHGSLTLHLSRAIHAANAADTHANSEVSEDEWKAKRRAVIHTADISPTFSAHAQKTVRGFRDGMYAKNIDFHVGDVSEVLSKLRESRGEEPFLSHAFLDMPAADSRFASVSEALRTDGTLIVFTPSITQLIFCGTRIKNEQIPLDLDKVLELGVNGGSGGREWDVRFVKPKAVQSSGAQTAGAAGVPETSSGDIDASTHSYMPTFGQSDHGWSLVCRPLVGERITGGGFLGIWRKQRDMKQQPCQTAASPEASTLVDDV